MESYDLPTSVSVGGAEREIRSDYRAALDVMRVLSDPELTDGERAFVALSIFYVDADGIARRDMDEAVSRMYWFLGGGEEPSRDRRKKPRLMDWDQDFPLIVGPVNRVLGMEVRSVPYDREANAGGLHWWTFLGAYREIGDCMFAQVVSIRKKRAMGQKLDKADKQFYEGNRELVDLRRKATEAEAALLAEWIT